MVVSISKIPDKYKDSCYLKVLCKKAVLKLFGEVTREHTWRSTILVKLQVFSLELYQNSTPSEVFSFEFSENFQNRYRQDTSERLFLLVPVKGFTL